RAFIGEDITRHRFLAEARLAVRRGDFFRHPRVKTMYDHIRAHPSEHMHDGTPRAAIRTGDKDSFTAQFQFHDWPLPVSLGHLTSSKEALCPRPEKGPPDSRERCSVTLRQGSIANDKKAESRCRSKAASGIRP